MATWIYLTTVKFTHRQKPPVWCKIYRQLDISPNLTPNKPSYR